MTPRRMERKADLFIEELYEAGVIDSKVFSIYIAGEASKISFGGFDVQKYAKTNLTWHHINEDSFFWEVQQDEMKYSLANSSFSLGKGAPVMIDSGTSYLLMPESDRRAFITSVERALGLNCFLYSSLYVCPCDDKTNTYDRFPDLDFVINGSSYTLPRDNYMLYEQGYCGIEIMSNPLIEKWILGLNFFENYYIVFDQDKNQLGFAPSKN
jgi:hypothetical protein